MYVTKKTEGTITTAGKTFSQGEKVKVDAKEFNYLKDTFPTIFEFEGNVETPKKEVKEEEEKPKRTSRRKTSDE